jgi:hypothetical protein
MRTSFSGCTKRDWMLKLNVDWKYWFLAISAGLAVGLLGMIVMLIAGDSPFVPLTFVGCPALFGAVFVYCVRSTIGANWWRGLCLMIGIVAAHFGGMVAAEFSGELFIVAYGATFAFLVAAIVALLFPTASNVWLAAATIFESGAVAFISAIALEEIMPSSLSSFLSSFLATIMMTFGLIYAVVAAFLGLLLFKKKTVVNG